MTQKKVCVLCGVVAALAIAFLRLSATKAEGNSAEVNSPSSNVVQQEIASEPKSMIGLRSVMAVVIKEVLPGSPAEQAGLRPGDLVTVLDEQIESMQDFQGRIGNSEPGTSFRITYQRFNRSTGEWIEHKGTIQTRAFRPAVLTQNLYMKVAGTRLDCPYGVVSFAHT
jgi:membrane-associated protease RseP (regulator of RpoE activity)